MPEYVKFTVPRDLPPCFDPLRQQIKQRILASGRRLKKDKAVHNCVAQVVLFARQHTRAITRICQQAVEAGVPIVAFSIIPKQSRPPCIGSGRWVQAATTGFWSKAWKWQPGRYERCGSKIRWKPGEPPKVGWNTVLLFGKHFGKRLGDVSIAYLDWLVGNGEWEEVVRNEHGVPVIVTKKIALKGFLKTQLDRVFKPNQAWAKEAYDRLLIDRELEGCFVPDEHRQHSCDLRNPSPYRTTINPRDQQQADRYRVLRSALNKSDSKLEGMVKRGEITQEQADQLRVQRFRVRWWAQLLDLIDGMEHSSTLEDLEDAGQHVARFKADLERGGGFMPAAILQHLREAYLRRHEQLRLREEHVGLAVERIADTRGRGKESVSAFDRIAREKRQLRKQLEQIRVDVAASKKRMEDAYYYAIHHISHTPEILAGDKQAAFEEALLVASRQR